jgi:hypothetical protein
MESKVLTAIDQKLSALLALAIAERLPETARARSRPLDVVLRDAGLEVAQIATLMGKSQQAVYQVLDTAAGSAAKKTKKSAAKANAAPKRKNAGR